MPNLKYPELFHLNASEAFDAEHIGGAPAPFPGIYQCRCGHEMAADQGALLSATPHPLHPIGEPNSWRLVAAARRNDPAVAPGVSPFQAPAGWLAGG